MSRGSRRPALALRARSAGPGGLVALVLAGATALAAAATPGTIPTAGEHKLTIERLYSMPWVTGTKPVRPAWAPDSRRLAFLWNDQGTNFYDVWVADVATATPVRVTWMPRPESPAESGVDVAKLEQVERAETDRGVSELMWAPDGRHLIFNFHGGLYQVLPGAAPERLLDTESHAEDAAVSARSGAMAFLSAGELWLVRFKGDRAVAKKIYAPGRPDVRVEAFYWSGDGRRIAIIESDASRVPVRGIPDYLSAETRLVPTKRPYPGEPSAARRLGVLAADGGETMWADLGGDPLDDIFSVVWSPDGTTLLVDKSDLYIKDRRLLLVDARSGRSQALVRERDAKNVTAEWWCDWGPDGRGIYFTSDRDNDYHVYYASTTGAAVKRITRGDFAVFSATVSAPASALVVVTNEGRPEERHAYRVPLHGGTFERLTGAAGTHDPLLSPDGRYLADIFSDDMTPPDLYLQRVDRPDAADATRQVTHSPLPEFAQFRWVAAKYVAFRNSRDDALLHARLTLPPDFDPKRKYPAILGSVYSNTVHNQWGGRIFHPTWGIDQYLAQQGYVIMNVDISGSSGHGKDFRQRIREDYGGVDVEDLYSAAAYLTAQGFVDDGRIGIWGSSYGGLLTTTALFARPGVFQAGVAGAPATSLFHALTGEMRTMMAPQDHLDQYARSSAFLKSGGLAGHLMIIHGMKDEVVLFKDSVTLEERLILQGKDIDLVALPNAPHGWDTQGTAQTRYAFLKLFNFFERYLKGPAVAQSE